MRWLLLLKTVVSSLLCLPEAFDGLENERGCTVLLEDLLADVALVSDVYDPSFEQRYFLRILVLPVLFLVLVWLV